MPHDVDETLKILMVTPYPPHRDGIAAYAVQQVRALRRAGHDVRVLSPGPSAAHEHLHLLGPRGPFALAKRLRAYDRVIVQFHPDIFYPLPATPATQVAASLSLLAAFRAARSVQVVVHEIDYQQGRPSSAQGMAARLLWRAADSVVVHTEQERAGFAAAFGLPAARIEVADHGANFQPRTFHDRDSARRSLGVGGSEFTFLSIGFVQPHKGFDRAVTAFAGLGRRRARLDIVGSVRVEEPGYLAYAEQLRDMADVTPGVALHLGYVSDELFDRWIVAADVVVLPYRSIWSSGVLERVRLFRRPMIATAVGGLPHQAAGQDDVTLVDTDDELRRAMWERAGAHERQPAAGAPWSDLVGRLRDPMGRSDPGDPPRVRDDGLRARVQSEVRLRAAMTSGLLAVPTPPAAAARGPTSGKGPNVHASAAAGSPSAPLRRLPPVELAPTASSRLGGRLVKTVVRRLIGWELEPVVRAVNNLRAATVQAVERTVVQGATATPRGNGSPPR